MATEVANRLSILACGVSLGLATVLAPSIARADDPAPMAPAPAPASSAHPIGIEGHVGIATAVVTVTTGNNGKTTTPGDQFTLQHPIGIGFQLTDKLAVDFETVFVNPIKPRGTTGLLVDPGVVYNTGPVVLGIRLALPVMADTSYGVIPLVHKAVYDLGHGANWFVELAFPTFLHFAPGTATGNGETTLEFNAVFHTGVGF